MLRAVGRERLLKTPHSIFIRNVHLFPFAAPNAQTFLLDRVRSVEDLNIRLSVCYEQNKPYQAYQLYEFARLERLPFDDLSLEYTVFSLTKNGHYTKAQELLENVIEEDNFQPSENCFIAIGQGLLGKGDYLNFNKLVAKM